METTKCKSNSIISANDFFCAWKECANTTLFNTKSVSFEFGLNRGEFTKIILTNEDSLVIEVSKKLGLQLYLEFRNVDAIFYKSEIDITQFSPSLSYIHSIRIAFEHELDELSLRSKLLQEISNLLTTNCELRVLVEYGTYEYSRKEFDCFYDMISKCKDSQNISDDESFLFILGNKLKEKCYTWEGYIFQKNEKKEWKKINESQIQ